MATQQGTAATAPHGKDRWVRRVESTGELALLLLIAGCVLLLAIPPAGVLVLLASALATIWGVLGIAIRDGYDAE